MTEKTFKRKNMPDFSDRLLYFQIGLSIALALALLIINYEKPKTEYESNETPILGLEMQLIGQSDAPNHVLPPEIKK
ncbi:MAG: hypothetical protein IIU11_10625 [Bacteroidales bacterium]|jgi:hypothetical protein|nr:hypothetical protein [Bacteroidales bacterium]MBR6279037.1 hypothetical protein [Bacteroidales bacterium]